MATLYSDLYALPPGTSGAEVYHGPSGPMTKGAVHVVRGTLTIDSDGLNAADVAQLLEVPEGAKLLRFAAVPSGDLDAANTFTFHLGWESATNEFASGSSALQGTTAFTLAADALIAKAASASSGEALVMTGVAGALSAGSIRFIAELTV